MPFDSMDKAKLFMHENKVRIRIAKMRHAHLVFMHEPFSLAHAVEGHRLNSHSPENIVLAFINVHVHTCMHVHLLRAERKVYCLKLFDVVDFVIPCIGPHVTKHMPRQGANTGAEKETS